MAAPLKEVIKKYNRHPPNNQKKKKPSDAMLDVYLGEFIEDRR
jgi:hypothetical protein